MVLWAGHLSCIRYTMAISGYELYIHTRPEGECICNSYPLLAIVYLIYTPPPAFMGIGVGFDRSYSSSTASTISLLRRILGLIPFVSAIKIVRTAVAWIILTAENSKTIALLLPPHC